jgi:hypothetical protein
MRNGTPRRDMHVLIKIDIIKRLKPFLLNDAAEKTYLGRERARETSGDSGPVTVLGNGLS